MNYPLPQKKMTKKVVSDMLMMSATYSEIGRYFNVSRQAVYAYCHKYKLHDLKVARHLKEQRKEKSNLAERKEKFMLGPEFYVIAKEKYNRKRANCKANKVDFDLEFTDIIWNATCPVFGTELEYYGLGAMRNDNSVSFDKIDPSKGYVKGNVQTISWRANRIKNDGTADEHRRIAEYIDKCTKADL